MSTIKSFSVKLILIFWLMFLILIVKGQKIKPAVDTNSIGFIEVKTGHLDLSKPQDDIDSSFRRKIQQDIQNNRQHLIQQGILQESMVSRSTATVSFTWPLKLKSGLTDPGFYGISNYIDHNLAYPNQIQDYNCGTRSYDVASGYNHQGTDIFTWPYGWYKMDSNQVEIIAAAAGIIVGKYDGNYDRSCAMSSSNWNAVYIQHADGSVAWYGHMKNGSLTTKAVGQTVVQGEYLGVVGSSGSSTGPHLHFEVYDASNLLVDPWNGPCNTTPSWWAIQQPYYNSQINKISSNFKPADFPSCPLIESPNESKNFCFGDTIYLTAFYRDQLTGQTATHKILTPSGTVWYQWTQNFTSSYTASWWYYSFVGLNTVGTWKYQITYSGTTYETSFNVGSSSVASVSISSPKTTICNGETVTFSANPANTGANPTLQWQINNVNVTGATGTSFASNTLNNGDVVRCVFTSSSACASPRVVISNQITMNVFPVVTPTISIYQTSGNNPSCAGQTLTFIALATNGGSAPVYQWKVNGVNTGLNSNVFSFSSFVNASIVTCQLTSNQICASSTSAISNSINLVVNPLPTVNAGSYPVLTTTSSPITLTGSPAGGVFSGTGVSSNAFNPTISGAGTFVMTYSYTNPTTGCSNTATTSITVTQNVCNFSVAAAITGNANVCGNMGAGDSATFSISAVNARTYTWTVSNATTMGISPVINSSAVKIKFSSSFTTGTLTVTVTGCDGTTVVKSLALSKTVPGTPAAITGPGGGTAVTYICPYIGGANVTYVATPPVTNATAVIAYHWTLPTGAQLVSVNASDSSSITIKYPVAPTTLTLSVLAVSGCGNSAAKSITLNVTAPAAPLAITGLTDVCAAIGTAAQSANVVYSIAAVNNAASYLWTVPTGVMLVSGQGTTSVNLVFASSFVSGNITVQSISPCGNSTAKSLTVYKRVAAAPAVVAEEFSGTAVLVAAKNAVCGLSSSVYRIRKVTYATSYLWRMKSGAKVLLTNVNPTGVNDTAVIVSFLTGFTIDTIQVQALTACSVSTIKETIVSAVYAPPTASPISGSNTPCIGNVITYYAAAPLPTATQSAAALFRWTKPNYTTIVSASADSSTINLSYNTGFTGGTITVKAQSVCGIAGTAASLLLQYLTPTPTSITSSTGVYNACIGTPITFTAVVPAPTTSQRAAVVYRWTKPNFTTITSATVDSSSIVLQFNTGYTGGSITVKGQTACGALGTAKSQVLTHTGCPTGTGNLPVTKSLSPSLDSKDFYVSVFPNPTSTMFTVSVDGANAVSSIRVLDMQGRVLDQLKLSPNEKIILGSKLNPGAYMLEVREGELVKLVRVVKY